MYCMPKLGRFITSFIQTHNCWRIGQQELQNSTPWLAGKMTNVQLANYYSVTGSCKKWKVFNQKLLTCTKWLISSSQHSVKIVISSQPSFRHFCIFALIILLASATNNRWQEAIFGSAVWPAICCLCVLHCPPSTHIPHDTVSRSLVEGFQWNLAQIFIM